MRSLGVCGSLLLAGCSVFLTSPPNHVRPGEPIVCSDHYTAPIVDASFAVVAFTGGAIALYERPDEEPYVKRILLGAGGGAALIVGAAYTLSAIAGRSEVARCRSLKRAAGAVY